MKSIFKETILKGIINILPNENERVIQKKPSMRNEYYEKIGILSLELESIQTRSNFDHLKIDYQNGSIILHRPSLEAAHFTMTFPIFHNSDNTTNYIVFVAKVDVIDKELVDLIGCLSKHGVLEIFKPPHISGSLFCFDLHLYLNPHTTSFWTVYDLIQGLPLDEPSGALPNIILDSERSKKSLFLQPSTISLQLHNYQKLAVDWMLEREGVKTDEKGGIISTPILLLRNSVRYFEKYYFCLKRGVVLNEKPVVENEIKGGLICEEMGLGKTVEVLSLVTLHRMPIGIPINEKLPVTGCTLIITPDSILNQWDSEVEKCTMGLKKLTLKPKQEFNIEFLNDYDIIFASYSLIQKDLDAALPGREGPRRKNRAVYRRASSLTSIKWWRVVLDEIQMVRMENSKAAQMAMLIPRYFLYHNIRINSWGVTGTPAPVTGTLIDMSGILNFVGCDILSWVGTKNLRDSMMVEQLNPILYRNTKDNVAKELGIPQQTDQTFFLPFSPIEFQFYNDLMVDALNDIGPVPDEIPEHNRKEHLKYLEKRSARLSKMKRWFLRLRQACCHPRIAIVNENKIMSRKGGTMQEVVEAMIAENSSKIQSLERMMVSNRINKGQFFDEGHDYMKATELYKGQELKCKARLMELENGLKSFKEEPESDITSPLRLNLNLWRELEHRCVFFLACSYHDLKEKELEDRYYEIAQELRSKMLSDYERKFDIARAKLKTWISSKEFIVDSYPLECLDISGGIATNILFEEISQVEELLLKQWEIMTLWVAEAARNLLLNLDGENTEATGGEYEEGINIQTRAKAYLDELESALHVREKMLLAEEKIVSRCVSCRKVILEGLMTPCNHLFCKTCPELLDKFEKTERKRLKTFFNCSYSDCEESFELDDLSITQLGLTRTHSENRPLVPSEFQNELYDSMKVISWGNSLQSYKTYISRVKNIMNRDDLPRQERQLALIAFEHMQTQFENQHKVVNFMLRQLLSNFTELLNYRTQYYTQLNKISDTVSPHEWEERDRSLILANLDRSYDEMGRTLLTEQGRRNFFKFLQEEDNNGENSNLAGKERICCICFSNLEKGSITECGHIYCPNCITSWISKKKVCAVCQSKVNPKLLCDIVLAGPPAPTKTDHSENSKLDAIMKISLSDSYGTKIDMILKTIASLMSKDGWVKVLIFSQWVSMLNVVSEALARQNIGYIGLDGIGYNARKREKVKLKKKGVSSVVQEFSESEGEFTAFMLHSKSQSSGLNIVSATHVFLVEPLVSKGLEQQAVGRIHRIGQTKETFVWRFLIDQSVEFYLASLKMEEDLVSGTELFKIEKQDGGEAIFDGFFISFFEPLLHYHD